MSTSTASNIVEPGEKRGNIVAQGEKKVTELAQENADSTESGIRYMAYAQRFRTALSAASRYTAYTSDVGEAFRPVAHPNIVRAAYGISWMYLLGDVSYETYKAKVRGPSKLEAINGLDDNLRLSLVFVKRSTFQALASMALPALTIHTVVRWSTQAFRGVSSPRIKAWGPTLCGLGLVPFLPYIFDHPVEQAVDYLFAKVEERVGKSSRSTKEPTDLK